MYILYQRTLKALFPLDKTHAVNKTSERYRKKRAENARKSNNKKKRKIDNLQPVAAKEAATTVGISMKFQLDDAFGAMICCRCDLYMTTTTTNTIRLTITSQFVRQQHGSRKNWFIVLVLCIACTYISLYSLPFIRLIIVVPFKTSPKHS